jgi:hypothetical protein
LFAPERTMESSPRILHVSERRGSSVGSFYGMVVANVAARSRSTT